MYTHIIVCKHVTQIITVTHLSVHINKYNYSYMCIYKYSYMCTYKQI